MRKRRRRARTGCETRLRLRDFHRPEFDWTSEMRLIIQPESYGAGSRAGSPTADHSSRPNPSLNPAIGFHAASGVLSIPSASQPFHGKFLSFTVRMNIGELRPAIESNPIFSTPS